jgi:tetratricopeptide (TPR) repeat protein
MAHFCAVLGRFRSARLLGCGVAALVFFTSLALSLQSQDSASLRGTVRDAQGSLVAGAAIHLLTKNSSQPLTVRTDTQGNYNFAALHAGLYALRSEMAGYGDLEIPSLFVGPKESKRVDLTLSPKNAQAPQTAAAGKPQFFDQPQFTVAGVTDTTSLGGHGSDTIVRTREALAKETVSLGKDPAGTAPLSSYERERDKLQALLAQEDKPELHHSFADIQEKLGNSLEAVREYQHAAELNPSEGYLFDWGSELLLHHAPEPALEVFTKGNQLFPRSVRMLIGLGAAWFARGSYDQAVQRICDASDLNPSDSAPYLFLGKMQSAEPTPSAEAVEKLHRFVVQEPENPQANYYYAVGLWKLRKGPEDTASTAHVEALLRNAIHLDPKYAAAYLQLGIVHSDEKDYAQAISDYRQAIQADPEMQLEEAHYRLAQAYRRVGDAADAEAELRIYDKVAKESVQKTERERHEVRQFVYTLRDQPPVQAP